MSTREMINTLSGEIATYEKRLAESKEWVELFSDGSRGDMTGKATRRARPPTAEEDRANKHQYRSQYVASTSGG